MKTKILISIIAFFLLNNVTYPQSVNVQNQQNITFLKKKSVDVDINRDGFVYGIEFNEASLLRDNELYYIEPYLAKLEEFSLYKTTISKKILEYTKRMENLKRITIMMKTKIDDEDLKYLQNLQKLQSIGLTDNNITGSGLKYLKDLPALTHLHLLGNPLKDEHLHYLADFSNLMFLDISNTPVTDKALQVFAKLDRVIIVALNTKITKKARDKMAPKMKSGVLLDKSEINF